MNLNVLVSGISVDLSFVVAGRDCNGEPAWIGPVVFVQSGAVFVDAWLGAGLSQNELPDVDDATLAAIEEHIVEALKGRDERELDGEYREPMTCDEVRAEYQAVDVAAEQETERQIAEYLEAA